MTRWSESTAWMTLLESGYRDLVPPRSLRRAAAASAAEARRYARRNDHFAALCLEALARVLLGARLRGVDRSRSTLRDSLRAAVEAARRECDPDAVRGGRARLVGVDGTRDFVARLLRDRVAVLFALLRVASAREEQDRGNSDCGDREGSKRAHHRARTIATASLPSRCDRDRGRKKSLRRRSVSELTGSVRAPASHAAVAERGAGMRCAGCHRNDVREAAHARRDETLRRRSIAELPALVCAPATRRPITEPRARMRSSNRDTHDTDE